MDAMASSAPTAPNPYLAPRSPDADPDADTDTLNDAGVAEVGRRWNALYVFDSDLTVDLMDVVDKLGSEFWGVSDEAIEDALIKAGAKVSPKWKWSYRARLRDALGVTFGKPFAQPVRWLVDGIVPSASVTMFVGPAYSLKTWAELALLKAVAFKEPWLGRAFFGGWPKGPPPGIPDEPARSIAVDFEGGMSELERRLAFLGDDGRVGRASMPKYDLTNERFWTELEKLLPLSLVAIDSLSRGAPNIDEKDSRFAEPLARAARFANEHDTTFVFLHHSPKDAGKGLTDVIRGTSALPAALDACFYFEAATNFESTDPTERRATVRCLKMRRGGVEPAPFRVRLTDAHGFELAASSPIRKAPTDEETVLATVTAHPGIGGRRPISEACGVGFERVGKALDALLAAGRIENVGTEARPRHQVIAEVLNPSVAGGGPIT